MGAALWCGAAQAQPPDAPFVPSPELTQSIAITVSALVDATNNDEGYTTARALVAGASEDARLGRAWRQWRRAALIGNTDALLSPIGKHLVFRSVEVEELYSERAADDVSWARVKVHLDVATASPPLPIEKWPAEPWQGEFKLQLASTPGARWQFVATQPQETPGAFFQFSQRGGNWLEQAAQVVRQPPTMLRTTRLLADENALRILTGAIQRYVAQRGHYPPSRYFAALLETEEEATRPALRRAFQVAGSARSWRLNPALAGRAQAGDQTAPATWLLWDGTARHPFFTLAGHCVVAFTDGRIEAVSAQDLQEIVADKAPEP